MREINWRVRLPKRNLEAKLSQLYSKCWKAVYIVFQNPKHGQITPSNFATASCGQFEAPKKGGYREIIVRHWRYDHRTYTTQLGGKKKWVII